MQPHLTYTNPNRTSLLLLKVTFMVSLLAVLLSMILSFFFKTVIFFYSVSYYLIGFLFLFSFLLRFHTHLPVYKSVMILIAYFLAITIPITAVNSNIITVLIFFKNTLLFLPIFLYFKMNFKDVNQFLPFLRTLVYGGVFFAFYVCFEFINKLFNIFPLFNSLIGSYVAASKQSSLSVFADPDNFSILSAIRPLGLEVSFTSGGYFLASVFFILLFSGHRFIKSGVLKLVCTLVLYIAVMMSTSRQNIFLLHLLLFGLLFIISIRKNVFKKKVVKSIRINALIILVFITAAVIFLFTRDTTVYSDFFTGKSGGTTEILADNLSALVDKQLGYLSTYPFNFFFGIGCYTPTYPGLYFSLPHPDELHFLMDTFYTFGAVGFCVFWAVFVVSLFKCWRGFKLSKHLPGNYQDLFLAIIFIDLMFIGNIIHYSPIGLSNSFIVALIPLFAVYGVHLKKNTADA